MLLYVAIVATLNLCAGYVLGVWYGKLPSWLGGSNLSLEDLGNDPFQQPSAKNAEAARKAAAIAASAPAPDPAPAPEPDPTPAEPVAAVEPTEPLEPVTIGSATPDAPGENKPIPEEVMKGLASFQAQLESLGQELHETEEEEAFDDCAGRMQQANHNYLDHAQDAIEKLDDHDDAADICQVVKTGAEKVQKASDEFDNTLASGEKGEEIRQKLRDLTDQLIESAKSVRNEVDELDVSAVATAVEEKETAKVAEAVEEAAPAEETPPVLEPSLAEQEAESPEEAEPAAEADAVEEEDDANATPPSAHIVEPGLTTLDSLIASVDGVLADGAGKPPVIVAAVQPDKVEGDQPTAEMAQAAIEKIGQLVSEAIGDAGQVAVQDDEQVLVLLPNDSVDQASRKIETIRQQVEATTFVEGNAQRSFTVSCGMTQSAPDTDWAQLLELLGESIKEAHRYGGNRACHHDGKFPAPVMPEDVTIEPRTVTV